MHFNRKSLEKHIQKLNAEIDGEYLYSPLLLNNETLLFPIMEKRGSVLVVSLNNQSPLIYIAETDLFFTSFENSFIKEFRKHYGKTVIKNLKISKTDNIVSFELTSQETGKSSLVFLELIAHSPNLVFTENNIIEKSYFKYKNRPSNFGEIYKENSFENLFDGNTEITPKILQEHFAHEIELRSKEKYSDFTKFLNNKIKQIKRKIEAINEDVKNADKSLSLNEIADNIFTLNLDLKSRVNSLDLYGEKITLDPSKTILENIQIFYRKSKKAKETISRSKINIENSKNELANFESLLNEFEKADEQEKDKIILMYKPNKKHEVKKTELNRPWKYNLNGTYIYFGRNASQNDYLSFIMKSDREFTWLHIKDKSGAHLIIANKKPTEKELLFACEFALICSHAKSGEIVYTKKKNVRKGHVLGEAILKNYSTIKLNNVREETIKAFENIKRCD